MSNWLIPSFGLKVYKKYAQYVNKICLIIITIIILLFQISLIWGPIWWNHIMLQFSWLQWSPQILVVRGYSMEFLTFYITLLHTDWFRQVYFKQINFWWKSPMRSNITHLIQWSRMIRLHFLFPHLAFYGSDLFKSKKSTFHIFVFWIFWKFSCVFWPVQRCRPKVPCYEVKVCMY